MKTGILLMDGIRVSFDTFVALIKAFKIRLFGKNLLLELPLVSQTPCPSHTMVFLIDCLVNTILFWKPGKCFYRSYSIAHVLRKRGLPLLFNFGVQMEGNTKVKIHCWLTLDDKPFAEKGNPLDTYPINMGNYEGQIFYWMGFEEVKEH